jgi:hypothetical protein
MVSSQNAKKPLSLDSGRREQASNKRNNAYPTEPKLNGSVSVCLTTPGCDTIKQIIPQHASELKRNFSYT